MTLQHGPTAQRTPAASKPGALATHARAGQPPPAAPGPELALAYAAAARVVRDRARNFYWGLRLTPEPRRSSIYAVYAWMRAGDDATDAPLPLAERAARLAAFRAATRHALARPAPSGPPPSAPSESTPAAGCAWWPALADAARRYDLQGDVIAPMLEGLAEDLDHAGYETLAELEAYCQRVAGTAGRACVRVWGVQSPADLDHALELADTLGVAFQLTNITRDLGEDARDGRLYVPRELLRVHHLTEGELSRWARPRECENLVASLVELARDRYQQAAGLRAIINPECRPTLAAMTAIYQGVLRVCARHPQRCVLGPRVRLSTTGKLWAVAGALLRQGRAIPAQGQMNP